MPIIYAHTHKTNTPPGPLCSYVKFMFSGSFLNFQFDVTNMASPASEVYWTVDNGPRGHSLVLGSVAVAIPPNNTHGDIKFHTVELFVKSTTERANRWSAAGTSTRIILTGVETDGSLYPVVPNDVNILIFGDSITEGPRFHSRFGHPKTDTCFRGPRTRLPLLAPELAGSF